MTLPPRLEGLVLTEGAHPDGKGCCANEAAAILKGEPHSATPKCVAPLLAAFVGHVNDALSPGERQKLLELVPALAETGAESDHVVREMNRRYVLLDFCARRFLPIELERRGLSKHARPYVDLGVLRNNATAERFYELMQADLERAELEPVHATLRAVIEGSTAIFAYNSEAEAKAVLYLFSAINLCFEGHSRQPATLAVLDATRAMIAPTVSRRGWA